MAVFKMKKITFIITMGFLLGFVLVGISLFSQVAEKNALTKTYEALQSDLDQVEFEVAKLTADQDSERVESVKEATGLDPAKVQKDAKVAESYFAPAFNWKSAKEYEEVRSNYIEQLGDSTFTNTYLPEDLVIDTNNGPLSYIDFKEIKTTMDSIHVVPMTMDGERIRYVAFVYYIMHKTSDDLANPSVLDKSEAIIEFTAAGDDERIITEIDARTGFHSGLN